MTGELLTETVPLAWRIVTDIIFGAALGMVACILLLDEFDKGAVKKMIIGGIVTMAMVDAWCTPQYIICEVAAPK